MSFVAAVVLNPGDACEVGSIAETCPVDEPCTSRSGVFTCAAPIILNEGDVCDVDDTGALCDETLEQQCLSLFGVMSCAVQVILDRGDGCVAEDTVAICDATQDDVCIDEGAGGTCRNLAIEMCLLATPVFAGVTSGDTTGGIDAFRQCSSLSGPELVYTYDVVADLANVRITLDPDVDLGLYVRTVCDDETSQPVCNDADCCKDGTGIEELVVIGARAGDVLTIFVDGYSQQEGTFDLTITEEIVVVLNTGDTCVVGDLNEICALPDACLGPAGMKTCTTVTTLARGDVCVVGDNANVCDVAAGDSCLADGVGGFTCQNPSIESCLAPIVLVGTSGTETGTLPGASAFNAGALDAPGTPASEKCTGYASTGPDVLFSVEVPAGATLNVNWQTPNDESVFIIDECPPVIGSCLIGADDTASAPEAVAFTNTGATGTFFIVGDNFTSTASGAYTLTWSLTGP